MRGLPGPRTATSRMWLVVDRLLFTGPQVHPGREEGRSEEREMERRGKHRLREIKRDRVQRRGTKN